MIDLANFFHGMSAPVVYAARPMDSASPCALLGPPGSGRSSLLFQYALQVASAGGKVTYVSSCEPSQQRRPLLPAQFDDDLDGADMSAFERVEMKYITGREELDEFLASVFAPPALLIIDMWTTIVTS